MAEEDNKNIQADSAGNVPADGNKPANQQANQPSHKKKRPRRRKRKPSKKNNEPAEEIEFKPAEPAPEIKEEPKSKPEPVVEAKPEQEKEEVFLASDENKKKIEPEVKAEETEEKPDEVPEPTTPPPPLPETKGPVGWGQLKEAIKKDYENSNDQVTPVPTPVPEVQESHEEAPVQEKAAEEEAAEEVKPEIVEPVPVAPAATAELSADEEAEKKEIVRIITRYSIGGCIIIAIIAGIFLFKLPQRIFGWIEGFSSGEQAVQQEVTQEQETTTPEKIITEPGNYQKGVGTALVTGENIPKVKRASSAIQAVYKIGLPEITAGKLDIIAGYMATLTKLQNAFATDIHQLLDASTNRAQALQVHLSELNVALDEAKSDYEELSTKRDDLKVQFNQTTTEKNTIEEEFFTAINNLKGNESNKLLADFIDSSARQVDLKAQYNALSKLKELYETAIANMEARIKDIELNKSPLISGVKVVDIAGSDLDLIIQESKL